MNKFSRNLFNDHADTEGTWAISYGDMVTLLLSFFVIFFSTDFAGEKEAKLEKGLVKNIEDQGYTDNLKDKFKLKHETQDLMVNKTVVKKMDNGEIYIFFPHMSFFKSGKFKLNAIALGALEKIKDSFLPYSGKYKLKIQAFTDDTPVRAAYRYKDNVELSLFRSLSVMRKLASLGVPSVRMELGARGVMDKRVLRMVNGNKELTAEKEKDFSRTVAFVLFRENSK